MLVTIFFAMVLDKRAAKHIYALSIGAAFGMSNLAFFPISGAALNPARWIGPCLMDANLNRLAEFWVYLGATLGGGICAALFYHFMLLKDPEEKELRENEMFDLAEEELEEKIENK